MCLKVPLLNLQVLKSSIKVWVWLEGNQGSGNRRFSWGTAPSPRHCSLLYCQLGAKPPVLFFVSSARPMQRMHPHSMMQYSHKKAALLHICQLWWETQFISWCDSEQCKSFHFQDLNWLTYHTVCIQKTLGVKNLLTISSRILNIHIFVASTLNAIPCYFIERPLRLKVSKCFQFTSKFLLYCPLWLSSSFCVTYLFCLPVADSNAVSVKAKNFWLYLLCTVRTYLENNEESSELILPTKFCD